MIVLIMIINSVQKSLSPVKRSISILDLTCIKFMTDGVLLKEMEQVNIQQYCVCVTPA